MDIEFIRDVDIESANEFHNRAYGLSRPVTHWRWQFGHLLGSTRPFVVAKLNGRIVGTQALMPITMMTPSGPIPTAKSEETLVDSSMRGKGVFQAMYAPLLELASAHGIQAIWGFTPAHKPFEAVGFTVPARTSQLVHPFSTRAAEFLGTAAGVRGWKRLALSAGVGGASVVSAVRLALSGRSLDRVEMRVLDEPPTAAAVLCRQFVDSWGGVTIYRDQAYLRWRYFENPALRSTVLGAYEDGNLVGLMVYSLDVTGVGYIVDSVVPRRPDARDIVVALFVHCVRTLRAAGAVAVRSWHVNAHPCDRLLREAARALGFFHVRRGEPVVIRIEEGTSPEPVLRDWNSWFVTRAFTQGESG
jgi:GNAT superfamily N-acetyltransferase